MKRLKRLSRILSLILVAVLILLLSINIYFIAAKAITGGKQPTLFGYSSAVVITGSMSGSIEVNDLVITHKEDNYLPGDIIMFHSGTHVVTHRIVECVTEGFLTKGDANNATDQDIVVGEQIIGKVILVIPRLGVVQQFTSTPLGMLCIALLGFLLIAGPTLFHSENTNEGGDANGKDQEA